MSKHSPRSVLKERYSQRFCRTLWKQLCAGCRLNGKSQTSTFTFYLAQVFSSQICKILKNFNNSVKHLRTGARAKRYLEIANFVIISYHSRLRVFLK